VLTAGIFLSQSFFTKAQILKVNVYEVSDHYIVDSTYTEKDIIEKTYNDKGKLRIVNTSYEFDLTNNRFYYYYRGKLELEGEILVRNLGQSQIVSLLIDGWDIRMYINAAQANERVVWYSIFADEFDIKEFTKFEIEKGV
jgi:hypothetical protein